MMQESIDPRPPSRQEPIQSAFRDDPEMIGIVATFLEELPRRISCLDAWFLQSDLVSFRGLVHQLKGAGGGYGFDVISEQAEAILRLLDQGEDGWNDRVRRLHERFIDTLRRAHDSRADLQA